MVYCQYTTAKGYVQALRVASCIRTALSRGILAIYHTPPDLIAQLANACHMIGSFSQALQLRSRLKEDRHTSGSLLNSEVLNDVRRTVDIDFSSANKMSRPNEQQKH